MSEQNTQGSNNAKSKVEDNKSTNTLIKKMESNNDNPLKKIVIAGSIRRKKGMTGLPGLSEAERVYKLGAALNSRTGKPLKGVVGEVEDKIMPSVISVSRNDNTFSKQVLEYWASFSVTIPPDEEYKKEQEQGKVFRIEATTTKKAIYEKINKADLEDKLKLIGEYYVKGTLNLEEEYHSDYLLVSFATKHSRVSNKVEDVDKSPKIHFYIYNKERAISQNLTIIELRQKAIESFASIQEDEPKLDAVLLMFKDDPTKYDSVAEKVIMVDKYYNENTSQMRKFVTYVDDKNLQVKALIKKAVNKGKLKNPTNSDAYYYNEILLGSTLEEAVAFLNKDTSESRNIRNILKQETK